MKLYSPRTKRKDAYGNFLDGLPMRSVAAVEVLTKISKSEDAKQNTEADDAVKTSSKDKDNPSPMKHGSEHVRAELFAVKIEKQ